MPVLVEEDGLRALQALLPAISPNNNVTAVPALNRYAIPSLGIRDLLRIAEASCCRRAQRRRDQDRSCLSLNRAGGEPRPERFRGVLESLQVLRIHCPVFSRCPCNDLTRRVPVEVARWGAAAQLARPSGVAEVPGTRTTKSTSASMLLQIRLHDCVGARHVVSQHLTADAAGPESVRVRVEFGKRFDTGPEVGQVLRHRRV